MSPQPPTAPPPIPVLVCGEAARGDDAAGFAAIDLLSSETLAAAQVEPVGQLDVLVLLDLPAESACVVVDAVYGLEPGEIWVRPLEALVDRARSLDAGGRRAEPRSSHELPIDAVLTLAATLRAAPPRGVFVGIGGSEFGLGAPMSEAVAAALPAFAAAIDGAVRSLLAPARDRGVDPALAFVGAEAPR
jgi:hydrogenase maturation protease